MTRIDDGSVSALECRRVELAKRISARGLTETQAKSLINQHGALEWQIAETPAQGLDEMQIKLARPRAALHPRDEPVDADCLESALLLGILRDIQRLNGSAHPNTSP